MILEYVMLTYFYYYILLSPIRKILLILQPVFLSIVLYDFIFFGNDTFRSLPTLIEYLIFIIATIIYFYDVMRIVQSKSISNTITFWICVGFLISFAGNFFYILVVDNYKSGVWDISTKAISQIIAVNCLVTISKNIFLSFSFFVKEKQAKTDLPFPKDLDLDMITPNQNTV